MAQPTATPALPVPVPVATPARTVAPWTSPSCRRTVLLGYSVQHRPITACERGTPGGASVLVVGVIHGNEQLGLWVVQRLIASTVPVGVDLWTIPSVNPDGLAADIRTNAHGVDENRNFPFEWAASSSSGTHPLSEPETQALATFLLTVRPRTVIIFHSPFDAVDYSEGGDPAVTQFLATAAGWPARPLGARPGS